MIRVKIKQTCRRISKTMLQKLPPRNPFWSFLSKLNAKKKKINLTAVSLLLLPVLMPPLHEKYNLATATIPQVWSSKC